MSISAETLNEHHKQIGEAAFLAQSKLRGKPDARLLIVLLLLLMEREAMV